MDEFEGIILYRKKYRDNNYLAKILTDNFGKHTFLIKQGTHSSNRLTYGLQFFSIGNYVGRISDRGFSFINEVISSNLYSVIYSDIERNSYVQYIFSLIDSAFPDSKAIPGWFQVLRSTLNLIEKGADPELMSHAFELKLLGIFGVNFDFFHCTICDRSDLPLDLSIKQNGMLCTNHQKNDPFRFHLSLRMVKCIQVLTVGSMESISKMKVDSKNMKVLRVICDEIYNNYIGIYPKTKSFIEKLRTDL